MAIFRLISILMVCNFSLFAKAAKVADDVISIYSENMQATQDEDTLEFTNNVVISFDDYIIHTEKVIIEFVKIDKKRSIASAIMPSSIKLLNKKTKDIVLADAAEYSRRDKVIHMNENVKIKRGEDLVVVEHFTLKLKD